MQSRTQKKKVANVRKTFYQLAVVKIGYPGAEVPRYHRVTTSFVDRLAVSEEAADLKKHLKML